jgi:DNA adenine methylase
MMPAHRVYLEPFAGGAAVLSAKPRVAPETLNDVDGRVVWFWRVLRERPDELAHVIALTPYSRLEWQDCKSDPDVEDDLEAARRFRVSVDQSFSREGTGWSPPSIAFDRRGRWQAGVWQNLQAKLLAAAERLSGVAAECADALSWIERYDQPDEAIYCDPPYPASVRLAPGKGYRHDVDDTFWPELVGVLAQVKHAAVLLSGYPCPEAKELGWAVGGAQTQTHRPSPRRRHVERRARDPVAQSRGRKGLATHV